MKGKPFDRYLQEALEELAKSYKEFNAQRRERLLKSHVNSLMAEELREGVDGFKKKGVEESSFKKAKKLSESKTSAGVNNTEGYHEKPDFTNSDYNRLPFTYSRNSTFLGTLGSFVSLNVSCSLVHREDLCKGALFLFESRRLHGVYQKGKDRKSGQGGQKRATKVQVVIDNATGQTVQVKAQTPEKALAEALSKLTPGVKTVVEE